MTANQGKHSPKDSPSSNSEGSKHQSGASATQGSSSGQGQSHQSSQTHNGADQKPNPGQQPKGGKPEAGSEEKSGSKAKDGKGNDAEEDSTGTQRNWMLNPPWWSQEKHGQAWETARQDVSQGWSQGRDKGTAGASAAQPAKDASQKRPSDKSAAEGLRFGVGAHTQYGHAHRTWSAELEKKLESDWESGGGSGMSEPREIGNVLVKEATDGPMRVKWLEAKPQVQYGYEYQSNQSGPDKESKGPGRKA